MTSSSSINRVLQNNKDFLGCFSYKNLPVVQSIDFPKYLIINTSGSKTDGHWVVVYLYSEKECFYFDSFGRKVTNKNLKKFLGSMYKFVYYNTAQIQDFDSKNCGLYSILFVKNVKTLQDYCKFINQFQISNLKSNDVIAQKLLIENKL